MPIGHSNKWTHDSCNRTQCLSDTIENGHTMVAIGHMIIGHRVGNGHTVVAIEHMFRDSFPNPKNIILMTLIC